MAKINRQTIPYAIIGLSFILSCLIPTHIHPFRSFYNDGMAILGVFLAAYFLMFQQEVAMRVPNVIIAPFALIMLILVQTAKGMLLYSADSIFPVIYLVSLIVAMTVGASLVAQDGGLKKMSVTLSYTFIAIGVLSFVVQLIQLAGFNTDGLIMPIHFDGHTRPYANLGQPNLLALLLTFGAASVWYLYGQAQLTGKVAIGLVMALLTSMVLTQSRIAWMILPMIVFVAWRRDDKTVPVSRLALLLLAAYFVALTIGLPYLLNQLGMPVELAGQRAGQVSVRSVMWKQAWTIANLHPWLGAGWFQFGPQQVIYATAFEPTEYSEFAHNLVLNFAAETGWPFTVILTVASLYWFYQSCWRRWSQPEVRLCGMILLAAGLHSLVEYPLWLGYILMPVGIVVGALHPETLGLSTLGRARQIAAVTILPMVVLTGAIVWDYQRLAYAFVSMVNQQANGKDHVDGLEKPAFTFYPQFYDYFKIINVKIFPGMPGEDIAFLERATIRFAFPPILQRLSLAYTYNHEATDALRVLLVIQKLHENAYAETYYRWAGFVKVEPDYFGEIFKRLPVPTVPATGQAESGSSN